MRTTRLAPFAGQEGMAVGVALGVGVAVGVAVGELVAVAVLDGVNVEVAVDVIVGVRVAVLVAEIVRVAVGVDVRVELGRGVTVLVGVGVAVRVLVGVLVFAGALAATALWGWMNAPAKSRATSPKREARVDRKGICIRTEGSNPKANVVSRAYAGASKIGDLVVRQSNVEAA